MIEIILAGAGILLCVALSAFFSGSEMALSSCNTVRLEKEAEGGSKKSALALKLARNYDDTLSAILVGNNLVNTAASSLTTIFVILVSGSDKLNWLGTVVVTILVIIFGETIPKIRSKRLATRTAANAAGPVRLVWLLFWPLNFIVVKLVGLLTMGIHEQEAENDEEELEELQSIIDTAEDEGVLDSERSELVSAAIEFPDVSAADVMTARVDMHAIDIEDDFDNIVAMAIDCPHSRLPVYEGSIDNIIGVVHLNHLLKALSESDTADIRALMMEPCYIYRTMKLPQVLNTLKKTRQHLAVVTDEYSGTLGVITMEDVLEQLVGEIWDETDTVEEEVVEISEDEKEIDGDMIIADFLELTGIPEEEFEFESGTVGGWIIEMNEGIFPEEGYGFTYHGFSLTVLKMDEDGRRVEKIFLKRLSSDENESENEEE